MEGLRVENLSKSFGALAVLDNLSFEIRAEERRVVVIGPNGAGKTTLFNLISGELISSQGTIHLFGQDVTKMPCHRRTRLGLARTFQVTDLFPYFTLMENLLLALQAHDPCKYQMLRPLSSYDHLYEKAEQLLKEMKLWEKKDLLISMLSHGETRLVEILLGVAASPRILLLDEPLLGLSPAYQDIVVNGTKAIRDTKGISIIVTEQYARPVMPIIDMGYIMENGSSVLSGTKEELLDNPDVKSAYFGV